MVKCYIKDYPRPQFVRKDWTNLNGEWKFCFDDNIEGVKDNLFLSDNFFDRKIIVPFSYETEMSGVFDESHHNCVWYSRSFKVQKEDKKRKILHFEGSDYITSVWINGQAVGSHVGGYSRFSFDITEMTVDGDNTVTVMAKDCMSSEIPRGKQRWLKDNFGCWYVQTTGIWKTVWLESVPEIHLESVKITPDLDNGCVVFEYKASDSCEVDAEITFNGKLIAVQRTALTNGKQTVSVNVETDSLEWKIATWSPENPNLYDVTFRVYKNGTICDEVGSYFGMRKINIEGQYVCLNNNPIYQRLILDQGYWEKSGITPPSEEALIEDIEKIRQLGFNGLRKHQKIEDERFLFWCDIKGMLVWSEMAAAYSFSDEAIKAFTQEWIEILNQNYNHPSIIVWTPFNESWGVPNIRQNKKHQDFTVGIYHLTKAFDSMRPVITNDGWEHTCSDIITLHEYEQDSKTFFNIFSDEKAVLGDKILMTNGRYAFAKGWEYKGQPVIISEYGGTAISGEGDGWGYGNKVENAEGLIKRYDELTSAIKRLPYVSGYCYTQVTDVQQETNGLMDIGRNFKCDPDKISEINLRRV